MEKRKYVIFSYVPYYKADRFMYHEQTICCVLKQSWSLLDVENSFPCIIRLVLNRIRIDQWMSWKNIHVGLDSMVHPKQKMLFSS